MDTIYKDLFIYNKSSDFHGMKCTVLEKGEITSVVLSHRHGKKVVVNNDCIKTSKEIREIENK